MKWLNSTFSGIRSAHLEYVDPLPYLSRQLMSETCGTELMFPVLVGHLN